MKFSDIPAQEAVKSRLRDLVDSDRLPHALLLEGAEGVGKFALARALAQYVHCENRVNGDSCGVCPSCMQHQTFNQPDTLYSYPVLRKGSGENTVSDDYAEQWRQYLEENPFMCFEQWLAKLNNANGQPSIYVGESAHILHHLSTTSYSSRYKIVVMWLPERMQTECANKMLKLIEEPHPDSLLILVSNSPREILPTVYSRLQRIEVKPLPHEAICQYLMSECNLSAEDAEGIAVLSGGSIVEAERRLSVNADHKQYFDYFVSLMRLAYGRRVGELRKWSVEVSELGREGIARFMVYCERMMRENFITNLSMPSLVCLTPEERAFASRFAPFINEYNVERMSDQFVRARIDILRNANAKIVLFDLAVHIILLIKAGNR